MKDGIEIVNGKAIHLSWNWLQLIITICTFGVMVYINTILTNQKVNSLVDTIDTIEARLKNMDNSIRSLEITIAELKVKIDAKK